MHATLRPPTLAAERKAVPRSAVGSTMRFAILRYIALPIVALLWLAAPAHADDLEIAKAVIGKQVGFIKTGNVAKLKAGFTARLQDRITAESIKKAQKEIGAISLDERRRHQDQDEEQADADDLGEGQRGLARRHDLVQVTAERVRAQRSERTVQSGLTTERLN